MVKFKFQSTKDSSLMFFALFDMVRADEDSKRYPDVCIGPFDDLALEVLGIIIDGKSEKLVADDFEELLKKKKVEYQRGNDYGVLYYQKRSY